MLFHPHVTIFIAYMEKQFQLLHVILLMHLLIGLKTNPKEGRSPLLKPSRLGNNNCNFGQPAGTQAKATSRPAGTSQKQPHLNKPSKASKSEASFTFLLFHIRAHHKKPFQSHIHSGIEKVIKNIGLQRSKLDPSSSTRSLGQSLKYNRKIPSCLSPYC